MTYDIWVDFNDIDDDSTTTTLAHYMELAGDVTVGQELTAGDGEGNRCPATVTEIDGPRIVLKLDLDKFAPAEPTTPPVDFADVLPASTD